MWYLSWIGAMVGGILIVAGEPGGVLGVAFWAMMLVNWCNNGCPCDGGCEDGTGSSNTVREIHGADPGPQAMARFSIVPIPNALLVRATSKKTGKVSTLELEHKEGADPEVMKQKLAVAVHVTTIAATNGEAA